MPLPLFALIGIGALTLFSTGSITATSLMQYKKAQQKLKLKPNGIPRPPSGMMRTKLQKTAQEKLNMDVINYYNFVFCGGTGSGNIEIFYFETFSIDFDLIL